MEGIHGVVKAQSGSKKPQIYLPLQQLNSQRLSKAKPSVAGAGAAGHPHGGATNKRGSKSGEHGSSRPCQEHSFLTDVADVRQMEQGLLQLLDDFHSGKLQAFGQDCTFEKMDQVREQQEKLARLHFEIDGQQELQGVDSMESREAASKNLGRLVENLQELCTSIQSLQKEPPPKPRT